MLSDIIFNTKKLLDRSDKIFWRWRNFDLTKIYFDDENLVTQNIAYKIEIYLYI